MKSASMTAKSGLFSLALFFAGLAMLVWLYMNGAAIDPAAGREAMIAAIWDHVGKGSVAAPLLLGWIGWRLFAGRASRDAIIDKLALVSLCLLALAVLFLVGSGPITVWTYGSALKVFDWFAIASPTGKAPALHSFVENAHVFVARATPWLVAAEATLFAVAYFQSRKN